MSVEVECRECGEEYDMRHGKCPVCAYQSNQPTAPQPAPAAGDEPPPITDEREREIVERIAAIKKNKTGGEHWYAQQPSPLLTAMKDLLYLEACLHRARVRTPSDRPAGEQAQMIRVLAKFAKDHRGLLDTWLLAHFVLDDKLPEGLFAFIEDVGRTAAALSAAAPVPAQEQEVDSGEIAEVIEWLREREREAFVCSQEMGFQGQQRARFTDSEKRFRQVIDLLTHARVR